jgi:hypothetical protein
MAMTLPAIQSARESGRRTQCKNNLRNIVQAANNHLTAQTFFPSGGWGYIWSGDPDRGYGMTQPGSWLFSILPYIEEQELHDRGKGMPDTQRKAMGTQRVETPVAAFKCPTRYRPEQVPYSIPSRYEFRNVSPRPTVFAHSDYAGNGGDVYGISGGPGSDINTTLKKTNPKFASSFGAGVDSNGAISVASEWRTSHIRDGLSKTYFAGERYLYFSDFVTGSPSDDSGWTTGYDHDTIRWTSTAPNYDDVSIAVTTANPNFGSSHTGTFNMAMCDSAVIAVPYEIDLQVHQQLGNRKDGLPENITGLQ